MSEEFNEWCALKHDCDYREGAWDAWQVQQARIDELMLEYCPDEMTAEQKARWAECQKPMRITNDK